MRTDAHFTGEADLYEPYACTLHLNVQEESGSPPAPLHGCDGAQLLRVLIDEQRDLRELAVGRRRGQHAGRQAVLRIVHQAVRRAAQQRQLGARRRQDLGLPRTAQRTS